MSQIKVNDITNASGGIPTVKSQQLIPTAWVNFNGTGTVAIRDSENVSSITDLAVGDFRITIATALASINYAVIGSCGSSSTRIGQFLETSVYEARTTTTVRVGPISYSGAPQDSSYVDVAILGGQS